MSGAAGGGIDDDDDDDSSSSSGQSSASSGQSRGKQSPKARRAGGGTGRGRGAPKRASKPPSAPSVWTVADEEREERLAAARSALRLRLAEAGVDDDDEGTGDLNDDDVTLSLIEAGSAALAAARARVGAVSSSDEGMVDAEKKSASSSSSSSSSSSPRSTRESIAALPKSPAAPADATDADAPALSLTEPAAIGTADDAEDDQVTASAAVQSASAFGDATLVMPESAVGGADTQNLDGLPEETAPVEATLIVTCSQVDESMAEIHDADVGAGAVVLEGGCAAVAAAAGDGDEAMPTVTRAALSLTQAVEGEEEEGDTAAAAVRLPAGAPLPESDAQSSVHSRETSSSSEGDDDRSTQAPLQPGSFGVVSVPGLTDAWRRARSTLLAKVEARVAAIDRDVAAGIEAERLQAANVLRGKAEAALLARTADTLREASTRALALLAVPKPAHLTAAARDRDAAIFGDAAPSALIKRVLKVPDGKTWDMSGVLKLPSAADLRAVQAAKTAALAPAPAPVSAPAPTIAQSEQIDVIDLGSSSSDDDDDGGKNAAFARELFARAEAKREAAAASAKRADAATRAAVWRADSPSGFADAAVVGGAGSTQQSILVSRVDIIRAASVDVQMGVPVSGETDAAVDGSSSCAVGVGVGVVGGSAAPAAADGALPPQGGSPDSTTVAARATRDAGDILNALTSLTEQFTARDTQLEKLGALAGKEERERKAVVAAREKAAKAAAAPSLARTRLLSKRDNVDDAAEKKTGADGSVDRDLDTYCSTVVIADFLPAALAAVIAAGEGLALSSSGAAAVASLLGSTGSRQSGGARSSGISDLLSEAEEARKSIAAFHAARLRAGPTAGAGGGGGGGGSKGDSNGGRGGGPSGLTVRARLYEQLHAAESRLSAQLEARRSGFRDIVENGVARARKALRVEFNRIKDELEEALVVAKRAGAVLESAALDSVLAQLVAKKEAEEQAAAAVAGDEEGEGAADADEGDAEDSDYVDEEGEGGGSDGEESDAADEESETENGVGGAPGDDGDVDVRAFAAAQNLSRDEALTERLGTAVAFGSLATLRRGGGGGRAEENEQVDAAVGADRAALVLGDDDADIFCVDSDDGVAAAAETAPTAAEAAPEPTAAPSAFTRMMLKAGGDLVRAPAQPTLVTLFKKGADATLDVTQRDAASRARDAAAPRARAPAGGWDDDEAPEVDATAALPGAASLAPEEEDEEADLAAEVEAEGESDDDDDDDDDGGGDDDGVTSGNLRRLKRVASPQSVPESAGHPAASSPRGSFVGASSKRARGAGADDDASSAAEGEPSQRLAKNPRRRGPLAVLDDEDVEFEAAEKQRADDEAAAVEAAIAEARRPKTYEELIRDEQKALKARKAASGARAKYVDDEADQSEAGASEPLAVRPSHPTYRSLTPPTLHCGQTTKYPAWASFRSKRRWAQTAHSSESSWKTRRSVQPLAKASISQRSLRAASLTTSRTVKSKTRTTSPHSQLSRKPRATRSSQRVSKRPSPTELLRTCGVAWVAVVRAAARPLSWTMATTRRTWTKRAPCWTMSADEAMSCVGTRTAAMTVRRRKRVRVMTRLAAQPPTLMTMTTTTTGRNGRRATSSAPCECGPAQRRKLKRNGGKQQQQLRKSLTLRSPPARLFALQCKRRLRRRWRLRRWHSSSATMMMMITSSRRELPPLSPLVSAVVGIGATVQMVTVAAAGTTTRTRRSLCASTLLGSHRRRPRPSPPPHFPLKRVRSLFPVVPTSSGGVQLRSTPSAEGRRFSLALRVGVAVGGRSRSAARRPRTSTL